MRCEMIDLVQPQLFISFQNFMEYATRLLEHPEDHSYQLRELDFVSPRLYISFRANIFTDQAARPPQHSEKIVSMATR